MWPMQAKILNGGVNSFTSNIEHAIIANIERSWRGIGSLFSTAS